MTISNNPPEVVVELTREQAEFLQENCETNMSMSLRGMMELKDTASRETLEKFVHLIDSFKAINSAVKKGLGNA